MSYCRENLVVLNDTRITRIAPPRARSYPELALFYVLSPHVANVQMCDDTVEDGKDWDRKRKWNYG